MPRARISCWPRGKCHPYTHTRVCAVYLLSRALTTCWCVICESSVSARRHLELGIWLIVRIAPDARGCSCSDRIPILPQLPLRDEPIHLRAHLASRHRPHGISDAHCYGARSRIHSSLIALRPSSYVFTYTGIIYLQLAGYIPATPYCTINIRHSRLFLPGRDK